jgi:hypothetical protein
MISSRWEMSASRTAAKAPGNGLFVSTVDLYPGGRLLAYEELHLFAFGGDPPIDFGQHPISGAASREPTDDANRFERQ